MIESHPVWKYNGGVPEQVDDAVAIEEPLEVRVRGKSIAVTMRTPGNGEQQDAELAAGFLMSEGLIRSADDIARIDPCARTPDGNIINVFLAPKVVVDVDSLSRHVFASSSCGICGKATIDSIHQHFPPVSPVPSAGSDLRVSPDVLNTLPGKLRGAQRGFDRTGGLHAAGLFDPTGKLIALREDVGRHNTVDKLLGYALLRKMTPLDRHIVVVSGRASFEIVQKALAARVPIVAAISAPSSLAVRLANESGMTLIGFLRNNRMNVYCGNQRVAES
jgi:FdhD protein